MAAPHEKRPPHNAMTCSFMVGVRRFELLTSSVSGKRSPPELNARICGCFPAGGVPATAESIVRETARPRKGQFRIVFPASTTAAVADIATDDAEGGGDVGTTVEDDMV